MHATNWITRAPIAHRGYHDMNRQIWENTAGAFARAIEHGFSIECDLQFSSDDVAVVFHDYETERLCGVEGIVRKMSSKQLTQLNIGGTTDRIPTFRDLLQQVKGKVGLVVEMKAPHEEDIETFARSVLDDLKGYTGNAALMSFNARLVETLLNSGEKWPVGLVAAEFNEAEMKNNEAALALGPDFLSFCVNHLPSELVFDARAKGLPVITWTVRDEAARRATSRFADQMTFEGFNPQVLSA